MTSPRQPTGLFQALQSRQLGQHARVDPLGWNEAAVRKLFPDDPLFGHDGCVNRLAWSESGDMLASTGDDTDVRLWRYPDSNEPGSRICVPTAHEANIFGVQFLPQSNNSRIITGAMDHLVQMHVLDATISTSTSIRNGTSAANRANTPTRAALRSRARIFHMGTRGGNGSDEDEEEGEADTAVVAEPHTTTYNCHRGRVKEVQVHPEEPHLFWSVSEDGTVRQFDTRLPNSLQQRFASANVLLAAHTSMSPSSRGSGGILELKSLAFNPLRPMQLAIGAGDHIIRLYDRRKLSLGTYDEAIAALRRLPLRTSGPPPGLTMELMPPHIAMGPASRGQGQSDLTRSMSYHPTHVTFGNQGDKLLATYHGDHAYCWTDILGGARKSENAAVAAASTLLLPPSSTRTSYSCSNPNTWNYWKPRSPAVRSPRAAQSSLGPGVLPLEAERHKTEGNLALFQKQSLEAIRHYTAALKIAPESAMLLSSRALAFLLRGWVGDAVQALQDAEDAIYYDPTCVLAQLRRAQALRDCGMARSAVAAVKLCRLQCTSASGSTGEFEKDLEELENEVKNRLQSAQAREAAWKRQREQRKAARRRRGMNFGHLRHRARSSVDGSAGGATGAMQTEEDFAGEENPPTAQQRFGVRTEDGASNDEEDYASSDDDDGDSESAFNYYTAVKIDQMFAAALEQQIQAISDSKSGDQAGPSSAAAAAAQAGTMNTSPWLWGALPSSDYHFQRYVGQCNLQTDIKEAVFLGRDDQFVATGSDDGRVYLFDTHTGLCLRTLAADEDVVNCIRSHPILPVLATSGIESTVKLWSPSMVSMGSSEVEACSACNQQQLRSGPRMLRLPVDARILEMLERNPGVLGDIARLQRARRAPGDNQENEEEEGGPIECRVG